jgi:futalosine hydrolase
MSEIVVCVATALEGDGLPRSVAGVTLVVVQTGVGPVNASCALTRHLARSRPRAVIACGVGGGYAASGLAVGDVVCAESETYADLGAMSPEGFLDMQALGFPVVAGPPALFNRLPLDRFPADRAVPFVTCSTISGTDDGAQAIVDRTGGAVESMEGAAIVHVSRLHQVPVGEIRGISNIAGRRDRANWRVAEAAAAARRALLAWIEAGGC